MQLPKPSSITKVLDRHGDGVGHFEIILCEVKDDWTPWVVWRYDTILDIHLFGWFYNTLESAEAGFKERSKNV